MSGVDAQVLREVRERLAAAGGALTPQSVSAALRHSGRTAGHSTVLAVHDQLRTEVVGLGPLEAIARAPGVTDVLVNGPEHVWVDDGAGLRRSAVRFADDDEVRRLAQRLAALGGRRVDDATPHVDVRLPDGTRCHVVLAPTARPGTALSLRFARAGALAPSDLAARGSVGSLGRTVLEAMVAARAAFLVTGGTGTGKTTVLAGLLGLVSPAERIVVVEDASELRPDHPHVVGLEARPASAEGGGEITLRDLVRQALRMRPDRLVVGEVRGAEVVEMLAALNTGHAGGCGTLHANSAHDVPARVEALALAAGLGLEATHSQLAAALDVVVHLARDQEGRRRVESIALPERAGSGRVGLVTAVSVDPAGGGERTGPGWPALADRLGLGGSSRGGSGEVR